MDHQSINGLTRFYKGKRVLVTGHTGFKGTWLSIWLKMLGADVYGFSFPPVDGPCFFNLCPSEIWCESAFEDIRNQSNLGQAFNSARPELVFHLAAQPLVRQSYEDPVETFSTNITGTVNLMECLRDCPSVKSCINVTSDKCYENKNWVWGYRENDPLGGTDPYSASKACSEIITTSYIRSFFSGDGDDSVSCAIATARAGNVIGGGDFSKDRLVPDMVKAFLKNRAVDIRYPDAVRPWQYVLEPLFGYLMLGKSLYEEGMGFSGAWNFGPAVEGVIDVGTLVTLFCKEWGEGATSRIHEDKHPKEAAMLKLDSSKAGTRLGWRTVLSLQDTIQETVRWYQLFSSEPDRIYDYSKQQIKSYGQLIDEV